MLVPEHRAHSLLLTQIQNKHYISSCQVHLLAANPSPPEDTRLTEHLQHKNRVITALIKVLCFSS